MLLKAVQKSCEKTTCVINEINVVVVVIIIIIIIIIIIVIIIIIIIISLFNVNKTKVENCNKKN